MNEEVTKQTVGDNKGSGKDTAKAKAKAKDTAKAKKESKRRTQVMAMERDLKAFDDKIMGVAGDRDSKLREVETEQRGASSTATRDITDRVAMIEKKRRDDIYAARQRCSGRTAQAKKDFIKEESEIERASSKERNVFEKQIVARTSGLQAVADGKVKQVMAEYGAIMDPIVEERRRLVDKLQAMRRGGSLSPGG